MIAPFSKCTGYYKHYKITVSSVPTATDPTAGVVMTTYVYNPAVSSVDPISTVSSPHSAFNDMNEFNAAVSDAITAAYPAIDSIVNQTPDSANTNTGLAVDIPDPLQQDLYNSSNLNNNIPSRLSVPKVSTGGVLVGPGVQAGADISGSPGYPQITHPAGSPRAVYTTMPFSTSAYVTPEAIEGQRPKDVHKTKKHRKGLGRNETVPDVVNLMVRTLDTIDNNRMRYVDNQTGNWANESRNSALDRLIGLNTTQVPLSDLYDAQKETTFTRYVYEILRSKDATAVIDGHSLTGKDLAIQYGKELSQYIDVLDGDNIAAIRAAAMSKRNTGVEFVPHSVEANIGVSTVTQETLTGGQKQERVRSPEAFSDTQYNQINFNGNIVPAEVFNDVYKPLLGISYTAPISWLDYLGNRRGTKRDNDAAKSILTLSPSASKMTLGDVYFGIANAGVFDMVDFQMQQQDRQEIYAARNHAGGAYYDLLINAKGLDDDPNTITLRRVVASFAAAFLCMKGQCSECKHYSGASSGKPRVNTPDGSAVLNASLTCAFGYTDSGGQAKGPESFCGFDELSPANPAMQGIRYEINDKVSEDIRSARSAIEKNGSEAYLSLAKQYGQVSTIPTPTSDVSAFTGVQSFFAAPPYAAPTVGIEPSA